MKRWTAVVLVTCAAAVAAAGWFVSSTVQGVLGILLLLLVMLTVFSQRSALAATIRSLEAAHQEQIDGERRYRTIFAACSDAILMWQMHDDGDPGAFAEINAAACRTLGYPRDTIMAMAVEDIFAPAVRSELRGRWRELHQSGSLVFETVHLTSEGAPVFVEVNARMVEIRGRRLCLAISRNMTARKEQEERLLGMSNRDELTGLLNRRGFFAEVEEVQRRASALGVQVLLMYVDVDGLKRVNDQMGHAAGDLLIAAAANVLRLTFRDSDVLARLGGDEFVALAVLGRSSDETLDRRTIMARFKEAVALKREELGASYDFSLSCGIVVATAAELSRIDVLLAQTDREMYQAKHARRLSRSRSYAR